MWRRWPARILVIPDRGPSGPGGLAARRQQSDPARGLVVASESKGTVVLARAVNLAVVVAKTGAGLLTLSSAMLAEAAHSWADTTTRCSCCWR